MTKATSDSQGRLSLQSEKMMDDGAAVTHKTSGHVDNVRVANYASLPAANIGTSTPTGEIEIFVSIIDGCAFCNHNELGRPVVAPTDEI